VRANALEKLCLEAGQGRLHSLSLAAMAISEPHDGDDGDAESGAREQGQTEGGHADGAAAGDGGSGKGGGVGGLALKKCPPLVESQMQRWMWAAAGGPSAGKGGGSAGGVSALVVFALDKVEKSGAGTASGAGMGAGEELVREVVASLFHRSARPVAILRALLKVVGRDGSGRLAPLVAYCERAVGVGGAVGRGKAAGPATLTPYDITLAEGIMGAGGKEQLSRAGWGIWVGGGAGGLLALAVRREAAGESDGVIAVQKLVRVLPWPVLLSQAVMAGPGMLSHGRVAKSLRRGLSAPSMSSWELRACARQILVRFGLPCHAVVLPFGGVGVRWGGSRRSLVRILVEWRPCIPSSSFERCRILQ
jgi:hypothetical protein